VSIWCDGIIGVDSVEVVSFGIEELVGSASLIDELATPYNI